MKRENQIKGVIGQIARIRERANLIIEREMRDADIKGVLPAHGSILYFLFQQSSAVSMTEIVAKVGRVKSTVTGMINTLERYGYVKKFHSLEDGRVMLVELTAKGLSLKPHFEQISEALLSRIYGEMTDQQKTTLVKLLAHIEGNLRST